jgi:hypothetical protein
MAHSWLGDAALGERAGDSWANYTLGWALLRWERVYPARDHIAAAHESFAQAGDATMGSAAAMACCWRGSWPARAPRSRMPGTN